MKKINSKIPQTLFFFLVLAFIISCSNNSSGPIDYEKETESVPDKASIYQASLNEKLYYKEFHLTSLMEEILRVNPGFEKFIDTKNNKSERPALYMEALLKNEESSSKEEEHPSLNAFTDLEGEDWYPILELVKEGSGESTDATYLLKTFDSIQQLEIVMAFNVDELGSLFLIDEDYTESEFNAISNKSNSSSVYYMSLGGCLPDNANQKALTGDCYSNGGPIEAPVPANILNIEKIEIFDKKESWIEKADIYFAGGLTRYNDSQQKFLRDFSISSTSSYSNLSGVPNKITKISNSELGQFETVNFKVGAEDTKAVSVFTVYEKDSWPAPLRYVITSLLGAPCDCARAGFSSLNYRSYQTPYFNRVFNFQENGLINGAPPAYGRTFNAIEDNFSARIKFSNY